MTHLPLCSPKKVKNNNLNNPDTTRHFMSNLATRDAETKIITISLPSELLRNIDKQRGVESRSSFIRRAALQLLR